MIDDYCFVFVLFAFFVCVYLFQCVLCVFSSHSLLLLLCRYVAAVVGVLVHESCATTGGVFEVGAGWVAVTTQKTKEKNMFCSSFVSDSHSFCFHSVFIIFPSLSLCSHSGHIIFHSLWSCFILFSLCSSPSLSLSLSLSHSTTAGRSSRALLRSERVCRAAHARAAGRASRRKQAVLREHASRLPRRQHRHNHRPHEQTQSKDVRNKNRQQNKTRQYKEQQKKGCFIIYLLQSGEQCFQSSDAPIHVVELFPHFRQCFRVRAKIALNDAKQTRGEPVEPVC
jgi:hypothetical protein